MRTRLSPALVRETIDTWRHLATWLDERGIQSLAACDQQVLHDYGLHLRESATSRKAATRPLTALVRLWVFDGLSGFPAGIARPPWDEFGVDDYLPAAGSLGGENAREPLAAETMGPLLVWAVRMVEDLSDDILAAWCEGEHLRSRTARSNRSTPAGKAALRSFFEPLLAAGLPCPRTRRTGRSGWPANTSSPAPAPPASSSTR
ncbi:hypothetical protein [Kitasatospora sp. NPDC058046]|uniref:hypothetical protein n=1 Tax=Kitasatospora sp. NPDC058046 TaxID=3346312 RepID=UPI0036D93D91